MSETPSKSSAPLQVLLMFAIMLATVLLGFYMIPGSDEERARLLTELGTTNQGVLLNPVVEIADLGLQAEDGAPWRWQDHRPKWRMVLRGDASCEQDCAELLYLSRQVHIRLGKYSQRFERVYVVEGAEALSPELEENIRDNHPFLKVVYAEPGAMENWLSGTNSGTPKGIEELVLVDPSGVAMMIYNAQHTGNQMLEDLNHLLKYSAE